MATTLPRWASRARAAALESRGDYVGAARLLSRSSSGGVPGRIRGVNAEQAMASRIAARGGDPDAVFKAAEDQAQSEKSSAAMAREEAYRKQQRAKMQGGGDTSDKESEAYYTARGSSPAFAKAYAEAERVKRKTAKSKEPAVSATAKTDGNSTANAFSGVEAQSTQGGKMTATGKASGSRERYVVEDGKKVPWEWWKLRARNQ